MLMDEAFSALDPLKRTEMQALLLQLSDAGNKDFFSLFAV